MSGAENESQDKPHEATSKRREDFRKEGKFPKARDTTAVAVMGGVLLVLAVGHRDFGNALSLFTRRCYGDLGQIVRGDGPALLASIPETLLMLAAPPALIAACMGTLAGGVQSGFKLYPELLKPKFDRLNPIPKLKKLLAPKQALYELTLAFLRVGVVGFVCYLSLTGDLPVLLGLTTAPVLVSLNITAVALFAMTLKALGALSVMVVIDYTYNSIKLNKEMRMSTQDLKDEMRQTELDPKLKIKVKQRMHEVSKQRIIAAVADADVIITNPTHISVAVRYSEQDPAPMVVAKGHEQLALRIRTEARKYGIPIIENRPLARAIYAEIEMGQPIFAEHYVAVAQVLAFVYQLQGGRRKRSGPRRRSNVRS